jgi:hypothetical protein
MLSTFPCATCGTLLNSTNTFSYQKHMTHYHWPGKNNSFPLSSIFTATSPDDLYSPLYTTSTSDTARFSPSVHSVLGKRKRSTGDDDDSGSTLRVRVNSTLACSTAGSVSGTSTPSLPSPSNITPKVDDFLASVGVDSSQIGKRIYFTLARR